VTDDIRISLGNDVIEHTACLALVSLYMTPDLQATANTSFDFVCLLNGLWIFLLLQFKPLIGAACLCRSLPDLPAHMGTGRLRIVPMVTLSNESECVPSSFFF
jgi:hypothetical protein